MTRRKKTPPKPRPSSWEISTSMTVNGRQVEKGSEITVRDHDGRKLRVRFLELVQAPAGDWITVTQVDKATGRSASTRSFDPSKILTVHRKNKTAARPKKGRKS